MIKLVKKLIEWFRSLSDKKVDWNKIDKSFLVFSDHPLKNNGWVKGWVKSKRECIVAKHSHPSVGQHLHVWIDGERFENIIDTVKAVGLDTTLCSMREDWPEKVVIYPIAGKPNRKQKIITFHQDKRFSWRRVIEKPTAFTGDNIFESRIIAGDSGLPWVCWQDNQFKVLSHNYRGEYGIGPKYYEFLKNDK